MTSLNVAHRHVFLQTSYTQRTEWQAASKAGSRAVGRDIVQRQVSSVA
jgi:hypothetical protein